MITKSSDSIWVTNAMTKFMAREKIFNQRNIQLVQIRIWTRYTNPSTVSSLDLK